MPVNHTAPWQACHVNPWVWLVAALATGLLLLAAALWADHARTRRRDGGRAAPVRGIEAVDAVTPHYVTQGEIDSLPLPAAPSSTGARPVGLHLHFGHLGPEFNTEAGRAVLHDPLVLMVDGEVTALREVLALLPASPEATPVVIAAIGIGDDVLATLKANRRALRMPVLVATPSRRDLYDLRRAVDGEVLDISDLRAGYLPSEALGRSATWISTGSDSWVEPRP